MRVSDLRVARHQRAHASSSSTGQFLSGREAEGDFVSRSHGKVDRGLADGNSQRGRKMESDRRLFREAEEDPLPVDRVREKEPFRNDRLVWHALGTVVNGRLQRIKVP